MSHLHTMPADVAEAVIKVMAGIRTLGKDDRNKHAAYDFVSTDKFLAAVNPLCAEAGLIIAQEEDSTDITTTETADESGRVKVRTWLTARYHFYLFGRSGAGYGPIKRTVMVQATGAQAFGSAQSYAEKQFMRSLFQISTGDKDDADREAPEELPSNGTTAKPPLKAAEPPIKPLSDEEWTAINARVLKRIKSAKSDDDLDAVLSDPDMDTIRRESGETFAMLTKKAADMRTALAIPFGETPGMRP